MSETMCLIDDCEDAPYRRGLCGCHYRQLMTRGQVGDIRLERHQCSVEGCAEPAKSGKADYCKKHYSRVRRHGHPDQTRPWSRQAGGCPVEGCDKSAEFNGMCKLHATRMARHGDPNKVIHQRDRNLPRGAKNSKWAGDDVTYGGMHQRVQHQLGTASEYRCAKCGEQGAQWSYDHADPAERQSPEGAYSPSIDHYVPLCVPCHKAFDLAVKPARSRVHVDPNAVRRLHAEGVRARAMAVMLGVSATRINRAFDELGLPRFPPGNPRNQRAPKPTDDGQRVARRPEVAA